MEGKVRVVQTGPERQAVCERYLAKFPFAREFEAEVARSTFYCFTPRWARLVDNARGVRAQRGSLVGRAITGWIAAQPPAVAGATITPK
mgnify:CR=1 FL=1